MRKRNLLKEAEGKYRLLHRQYEILQKNYAANAELFHDMDHHLQVIYHLAERGENEKIRDYIAHAARPVRELSGCVWTGVDIVDAIINQKKQLAEEKGYAMDINAQLPYNTGIASDDFCTILSNLLDNCLEAMDRQRGRHGEQPPEGAIQLILRRINHFILIQAGNPCTDIRGKRKGLFPTSKKNKLFHGWGLKSVEAAVHKYEGTLHCEVEGGRFTASAMLFFPETDGKAENLRKSNPPAHSTPRGRLL